MTAVLTRRSLLPVLVVASALLVAACGSQRTATAGPSGTPRTAPIASASGTARVSAATATSSTSSTSPGHDSHPIASAAPPVQFVIGLNMTTGRWTLLKGGNASNDSELEGVANLLAAAVPLTPMPAGTPPLTCGPSGVMLLPPEHLTPRWTIGLRGGAIVQVVADLAPCGANSTSYATDEYASLNGHPTKAIGLVGRLLALSQALAPVEPLAVSPATPSPGGTVQLTGDGWVGGSVAVTVSWCHQRGAADCTVKPLASLTPDAQGKIAWRGRLPAGMPAGGTGYDVSLAAKNGLLDFVINDLIR